MQHPERQADLSRVVHAQCALHGDQTGTGSRPSWQGGAEVGEHLAYSSLAVRPFGAAPSVTDLCRPGRWSSDRQDSLRHHCGLGCGGGARGAHVRQPPQAAAALAREQETDGAVAAAMAWMPAAASLVALTCPQMRRQQVLASV